MKRHQKNYHRLSISAVNKYGKILGTIEKRDIIELNFGPMPKILREEYLDIYEGYTIRNIKYYKV